MTSKTSTPAATTFADLDPTSLIIEANVRTDAGLTPGFVASIRENGVLMPILVQHVEDGTYLVRAGQRRTLAAIEAGLPTIPARVVTGDGDQARRIIEQIIENDDRAGLDNTDRAAAFQQLALLGVPAETIAKRTGRTRQVIEAGITVAGSRAALTAVTDRGLDLVDAAIYAEFEGDEDAIDALDRAARFGRLEHTAQRIRDHRAEEAAVAKITADLTAAGVPIRRAPGHDGPDASRRVDALRAKGSREPLTVEQHTTCPGHAAYIDTDGATPTVVYVCADYKTHGHQRLTTASTSDTPKAEWTDEQKAERRTLIANNKAWQSAEVVRREWLAGFAARKSTPKDAPVVVAGALIANLYDLGRSRDGGWALARTLLGLPARPGWGEPDPLDQAIAAASPARAQHLALVLVLSAIEESTSTRTWRSPGPDERDYFAALARWGYKPSEVEELVSADPTPTPAASEDE